MMPYLDLHNIWFEQEAKFGRASMMSSQDERTHVYLYNVCTLETRTVDGFKKKLSQPVTIEVDSYVYKKLNKIIIIEYFH